MNHKDEFLASWRVLREDWVFDTEGDIKKANQIMFGSVDSAPDEDQEQANNRPMLEVEDVDEDVDGLDEEGESVTKERDLVDVARDACDCWNAKLMREWSHFTPQRGTVVTPLGSRRYRLIDVAMEHRIAFEMHGRWWRVESVSIDIGKGQVTYKLVEDVEAMA